MMLREALPKEAPPLKISKILKIPLFLELETLKDFFSFLLEQAPALALYASQKVSHPQSGIYGCNHFIQAYQGYLEEIHQGQIPSFPELFSYALSETPDIFVSIPASADKRVIRPIKPPLQLQPHSFYYSPEADTFYSMAFGEKSISLGFQLSYPLLYQDPHSGDAIELQKNLTFPNLKLFHSIRTWVRHHTVPLSCRVQGKKTTLPIRIGKQVSSLFLKHAQLQDVPFTIVRENTEAL